jgi:hypothetical protein
MLAPKILQSWIDNPKETVSMITPSPLRAHPKSFELLSRRAALPA